MYAVIVGAGVLVASLAIYMIAKNWSENSSNGHYENGGYSYDNDSGPPPLGDCCHCKHDVHIVNGRKTPCGHFIHYTCEAWLRKECRSGIHWKLVCTFCLTQKMEEMQKRKQNAVTELGPCCRCKDFVDDANGIKTPCGHFMHKICEAALRERFSVKFEWSLACKTCLIELASRRNQRNNVILISALGSCCRCSNIVETDNGRNTPCDHYVHDICRSFLYKQFPDGFEWSMVCRICSAASKKASKRQQKESEPKPMMKASKRQQKEPEPKPMMLGSCCQCNKTVEDNKGHKLSCGHFIHNACEIGPITDIPFGYDLNMRCKICLIKSMKESEEMQKSNGLRKRVMNSRECGNCGKNIKGVSTMLECRHEFHEECWKRMKETSTTCPTCIETHFDD